MQAHSMFERLERSREISGTGGGACRGRLARGFTMLEILFVIVLLALVLGAVAPYIQRILRREKLRSSVREVYSIVLAARMQAVKLNRQVVVFFDIPNHRVQSWADLIPYDYTYDPANETLLASYPVPNYVYFCYAPDGIVDDAAAVAFDTYAGNAAYKDMIVFQGDGTILAPQDAGSNAPKRPSAYTATVPSGSIDCNPGGFCRGIYMSDGNAKSKVDDHNTFRISVDDFGASGKASLLKWLPTAAGGNAGENNYVPSPWRWAN